MWLHRLNLQSVRKVVAIFQLENYLCGISVSVKRLVYQGIGKSIFDPLNKLGGRFSRMISQKLI